MKQITRNGLLALALFGAAVTSQASGSGSHWGYYGDEGPDHWGDLSEKFATCKTGEAQSPINITTRTPANLPPLQIQYRASNLEIVNNGHTIQVNVEPGSRLLVNDKSYELKQFHFHTHSEHELDGHYLPMEMHFVHKSDDGELAVIGVLARTTYRDNPVLARIWEQMPQKAGESVKPPRLRLNPVSLMPAARDYVTYSGSLTTPPCTEGVRWIVMQQPARVSGQQVQQFTKTISDNARPVQPLNDRQVLSRH
jgi:carbonic anhydrase